MTLRSTVLTVVWDSVSRPKGLVEDDWEHLLGAAGLEVDRVYVSREDTVEASDRAFALPSVLITVQNGAVDYVTNGPNHVVFVDFDSLQSDTTFPDDISVAIEQVLELPHSIPWREGIVRRLNKLRTECTESLRSP